jgi:hypothetical protein
LKKVADSLVVECGFGTGPGFCTGMIADFAYPTSLVIATNWIENYRHTMRKAHIKFDDGFWLWFLPDGFERHDLQWPRANEGSE